MKKIRFLKQSCLGLIWKRRDFGLLIDVPLASSSISLLRRGRLHFFSPLIAMMMMIRITIDSPALLRLRSLLRWCLFGVDDR